MSSRITGILASGLTRKLALSLVPLVLLACGREPVVPSASDTPLFSQAPADGNGNKAVFPFDATFPVNCSAQTLTFNIRGWVQIRIFGEPGNRNVQLDVFHGVLTYTNSAGETFVWHDVGPDHISLENGDVVVAVVGTSTFTGVIGRVVLNLTTGDVQFIAGNELGNIDELACAALT